MFIGHCSPFLTALELLTRISGFSHFEVEVSLLTRVQHKSSWCRQSSTYPVKRCSHSSPKEMVSNITAPRKTEPSNLSTSVLARSRFHYLVLRLAITGGVLYICYSLVRKDGQGLGAYLRPRLHKSSARPSTAELPLHIMRSQPRLIEEILSLPPLHRSGNKGAQKEELITTRLSRGYDVSGSSLLWQNQ